MNLLSNSVKFTPAGGEIVVRVRVQGDRGVLMEVRDNGIGIAPEDIARALSPFGQVDSRLSRRYEGTGLGLPLARRSSSSMAASWSWKAPPASAQQCVWCCRPIASSSARCDAGSPADGHGADGAGSQDSLFALG